MKRVASVIVFKEGTSKAAAVKALLKIADIIEPPMGWKDDDDFARQVREFDDRTGWPVFYIP